MNGKKLLIVLVIGLSLFCTTSYAGLLEFTQIHIAKEIITWQPKWEVGDWWIIETTWWNFMSAMPKRWNKPFVTRYEVVGIEEINLMKNKKKYKFQCYVIKAEYKKSIKDDSIGEIITLYYKVHNLSFYMVVYDYRGKSLKNGESMPYVDTYNITSNRPVFTTGFIIPFDTPVFPFEFGNKEKIKQTFNYTAYMKIIQEISFDNDWSSYVDNSFPMVENVNIKGEILSKCKVTFNLKEECFKVVLKTKGPKGERVSVTQYWHPKSPWFIFSEIFFSKSYLIDHSWRYKKDN
ncbi:hypothetical protein KAU33_01035 [Candidatus Dependentiae bacterium]|nr:hypothetical protein [Candidatus Dependentiae bacterium]